MREKSLWELIKELNLTQEQLDSLELAIDSKSKEDYSEGYYEGRYDVL